MIEETIKVMQGAIEEIQQLREEIAVLSRENGELMKERNYLKATIFGLEKELESKKWN